LPGENEARWWYHGADYMPGLRGKEAIPNSEGTEFEKRKLRGLQSRSRRTEATIWIGKEGASDALVSHVENQLKTRELVKVKLQRSMLRDVETGDIAKRVAASTGSTLVEVMGHTFTLYRKRSTREVQRKIEN
jgi:RNA-binding protein